MAALPLGYDTVRIAAVTKSVVLGLVRDLAGSYHLKLGLLAVRVGDERAAVGKNLRPRAAAARALLHLPLESPGRLVCLAGRKLRHTAVALRLHHWPAHLTEW